jgi:hypothetical protein
MTDSKAIAATQKADRSVPRHDHALRARFERHRALRSAWGVLAPSGLSTERQDIAETGRALNDELMKLASQNPSSGNAAEIREIDTRLDAFECEMRAIAVGVPVAQLRSTLPPQVAIDRRGVLDLLDLMLGAEIDGLSGTESRIAAIDYLITLLCTADAGTDAGALRDPVTLTPRLYGLCERSDVDYDPRLPEIEAEFFAAADMYAADARGEIALRALRRRKVELGPIFFAPRVLRAIVTYNAALMQRIDEAVLDSLDWGSTPRTSNESSATPSLFEAPALPKLAEALRRRAAGDAPKFCALDRVAWCLDLSYLDKSERAALLSESVGLPENVKGTAILLGLLCRSAVVLEDEFSEIGISPLQLSGEWIQELDDALKREINRRIAGDDYREACLLSELKGKLLYTPMAEVHRKNRGRGPTRPVESSHEDVGEEARQIAEEALESEHRMARPGGRGDWKAWPWARLAPVGVTACCALLALALAGALLSNRDLERLGSDDLDRVSPYLSRGARSGEGKGSAFVGTIDEDWSALEGDGQMQVAENLVQALRAQGVREIMVFDGDRRLRIQALGAQPVRVLPAGNP